MREVHNINLTSSQCLVTEKPEQEVISLFDHDTDEFELYVRVNYTVPMLKVIDARLIISGSMLRDKHMLCFTARVTPQYRNITSYCPGIVCYSVFSCGYSILIVFWFCICGVSEYLHITRSQIYLAI